MAAQRLAQRREAERQAKERARLAKEREQAIREEHLAAQQRSADTKTAALEQQVKELDQVLTSALRLRPLSFANLMTPKAPPRFEPGTRALGKPPPNWDDFAP